MGALAGMICSVDGGIGSAWFNRCCSVTGLVDGVSVCAPAPTPRLGRASAAAALPWRPQGAASSS
ncbi:hypothetical protein T492DRAFT_959176 [Pavlovales sp. CCMP2436]|nr:hypothetical protein T492DRAFT_959176 [Pavlovales sp. CCMP2436]